ncbi:MAG: hypothetical protein H7Z17_15555 [Fuerstia sp.]|nr:hypothetical protein [Fuerstiella sp.]
MPKLTAQFGRVWNRAGTWLLSVRGQMISVLVLLAHDHQVPISAIVVRSRKQRVAPARLLSPR